MDTPEQSQIAQYSLSEIAGLIIRDKGIHEGLYDLSIEFQFAAGSVGPAPELSFPGAMMGISRIGLVKSPKSGQHTVDAAIVNPKRSTRKKSEAK